jgi:hypothetical protein
VVNVLAAEQRHQSANFARRGAGRADLLAAVVDEHCPVLDLFKNPVPVTRTLAG